MGLLFKFLSVWPLGLLHAVGWCLGWLAFGLSGSYRAQFRQNAGQAGLALPQSKNSLNGAVGAAGQLLAELPRLWFGKPVPIEWDGTQHIEAALALGKGIVFLTPHLGCFEVTAQAYAQRFGVARPGQAAKPMTVLYRPPRKTWLTDLVSHARTRPGLQTAPTTLAGVKQLIRALKAGECVGLLPDQVPPLGQGVWAPFFGKNAYTMTLATRLAQQTGATTLIAWGERLPAARGYVVHVNVQAPEPTLVPARESPASLAEATTRMNLAMQQLIAACPQQYLWGYARYKPPRAEP